MMEAASTSEASLNLCQTIRRNNPEDSHPQSKASSELIGVHFRQLWLKWMHEVLKEDRIIL
jgi:hypothetical protein